MKIVQNVVKKPFVFFVTLKEGTQEQRTVEAESAAAARLMLKRDANIRTARLKK